MPPSSTIKTIGLFGFGQFGRLVVRHLSGHFDITIHDPAACKPATAQHQFSSVAKTAGCDLVILAVPVSSIAATCQKIRDHLKPDCIVMDVGSVKMAPAEAMLRNLPDNINVIGSHPLFGPQSAANSLEGHKIAICNIRGRADRQVSTFLRRILGLKVYTLSAEEHDREAAVSQGLTHLIAKVPSQMDPLPTRMTTVSFDLLLEAIAMVKNDPPNVFAAIEQENPFAAEVRQDFLVRATKLGSSLTHSSAGS